MLKYGPDNNFHKFKEKLVRVAMKEYGDLGRLIETGEYYERPEINSDDYNLEDGPYGLNLKNYKEALKMRQRQVVYIRNHRANLYAMIEQKLSAASLDVIKRHEHYKMFHTEKNDLMLY